MKKTDARVQAVLKWVTNNYTVDENPGIGQHTVYYYYMVFAKALQAVAIELLDDHLSHCVADALTTGGKTADDKVAEATAAIARLVRS